MPLDIWLAFAFASAVLLAIPGPTVMLVVSYAIGRGRQSGWRTVPGVTLGDCTAMTVSLPGAGAVLAASATLFTALKFAGAVYLVWLGIRLWRTEPAMPEADAARAPDPSGAMFWHAYADGAQSGEHRLFHNLRAAVHRRRPGAPAQVLILELTFVTLAVVNAAICALVEPFEPRRPGAHRKKIALDQCSGAALSGRRSPGAIASNRMLLVL